MTDVLIAGAGPTGLTLALELARRGISFRLIDRLPRRGDLSKALVVQPRSLEVLAMQGMVERFLERGYPAPGLNISLGSAAPVSIGLRELDTPYPYLLVIPQAVTESLLEQRLNELGHCIERGSELIDAADDPAGCVEATIRRAGAGDETIRVRYLVGCEGTHSIARQRAGLDFSGKDFPQVVFLADVRLDAPFIRSRITNFTSDRGFVSILPFLGEYSRIFAVDHTKQENDVHEPLALEDLQETIDAIVPFKMKIREPRWITRFKSPSRFAARMRRGRIFIAGDAAHAHSPAGGQGMNSGIQDAFNLGWKLAMVIRGNAAESLLDTYDEERRPVDADIQVATDRMFASFLLRNRAARAVRDLAIETLVKLPATGREFSEELSGIGIGYSKSPRAVEEARATSGAARIRPGDRVPDIRLWQQGRPTLTLFEALREGDMVALLYCKAARFADQRDAASAAMERLRAHRRGVSWHVVMDEGADDASSGAVPMLLDAYGDVETRIGAAHGSVIVVRPDGYLGAHRGGFDCDGAIASCSARGEAPALT